MDAAFFAMPSGSAVTASPKAAAGASSPGAAKGPADASSPGAANGAADGSSSGAATRAAANDITDRPAAGSRRVQALPAPVALSLDLAAPADALEGPAGSAPLQGGSVGCAAGSL